MTDRDLERQALAIECTECGARAGKKCRMIGKATYQSRRPHPARVEEVWREYLRVTAKEAA